MIDRYFVALYGLFGLMAVFVAAFASLRLRRENQRLRERVAELEGRLRTQGRFEEAERE
jgi:hypothetical protein